MEGQTNRIVKVRKHAQAHILKLKSKIAVTFRIKATQLHRMHDLYLFTFDFSFPVDLTWAGRGKPKGQILPRGA